MGRLNRNGPPGRIEDIVFKGVFKRYGENTALGPLDFTIRGGELLVIVGCSGCGKTTMLRLINRLLDPDQGEILINSQDTRTFDPIALRRGIGYVIQQIGLFPHMTVGQNIGLVLSLLGHGTSEVEERVRDLMEMVRLPPDMFVNRFPRDLSGGQQQRVGLARALATDPPLLLMDEPFGALDPLLRGQLQKEFLRIREDLDKTIIFVTHDLDEAFLLGDRIAVMQEGRVVRAGTPEELLLDPGEGLAAEILGSRALRHLERLKVRNFLIPIDAFPTLPDILTAREALAHMQQTGDWVAVVTSAGEPGAVITGRDLIEQEQREIPLSSHPHGPSLPASGDLPTSLRALRDAGRHHALIEEKGTIIGVFSVEDTLYRVIH